MTSRHIPEEIKRKVRQRCKFGCVICGVPIYHYDHIEPYAAGGRHEENNLALLCPTHHQDKTSGRVTPDAVRRALSRPANANQPHTAPHIHVAVGDRARFVLGGVIYESEFAVIGDRFEAIHLHGHTVLGVTHEDGNLLFDILLTDEAGNVVFRVNRGELVVATGVWDYLVEGNELEIRSSTTTVCLRLRFEEHGFSMSKGHFVVGDTRLTIEPNRQIINSAMVQNMVFHGGSRMTNCRGGIHFG